MPYRAITDGELAAFKAALKIEKLISAIADLGYPVGMGLGPHPKDAEKIIRELEK